VIENLTAEQAEMVILLSDVDKHGLCGLLGHADVVVKPNSYVRAGLLCLVMRNLDNPALRVALVRAGLARPQWFGLDLPDAVEA
jgi:hypothetical protein